MMNKIWCFMILAGLIVSSFNGKITTLSDTILSSSKEAVELCILMFGIVGLWSGLMNIALSLGITTQLQKLLTPFLTFLFHSYGKIEFLLLKPIDPDHSRINSSMAAVHHNHLLLTHSG